MGGEARPRAAPAGWRQEGGSMSARSTLEFSDGAAGPLVKDPDRFSVPAWTEFALCAQVDPEAWYVERGGDTAPAKAVCRGCTVRDQCLAMALDRNEMWGVWGGLSRQERLRAARLLADGWSIADVITAYDAAFYARADAADEAKERKRAAERDYRAARKLATADAAQTLAVAA
jgi:WhiB family redox-sensing transcriptional regulator